LAAARRAIVIATARPGPEAAFVTALGATHTVDHTDLVARSARSGSERPAVSFGQAAV